MSLSFRPVSRKNPLDPAAAPKYYASAISSGRVDLDTISKRIANSSTMSRGDISGVILTLVDEVLFQLAEGKIVELGKLGTLRLTVNSEGVETAEKVNAAQVKKVNIRFKPGSDLTGMVKNLKMTREAVTA